MKQLKPMSLLTMGKRVSPGQNSPMTGEEKMRADRFMVNTYIGKAGGNIV
jgi:hypothetical protein